MMIATACAVVIGVSAVVIAKKRDATPPFALISEIIEPSSGPGAEPLATGLGITLAKAGLTIVVPDCNIEKYKDRFFLHVFPVPYGKSSKYANLDFSLASEKEAKILAEGKTVCSYTKSFKDLSVSEVTVGQFSAPDGACCKILWSRNYVFDRAATARNE